MILSLCIYLIYLRNEEEKKEIKNSLTEIVYDNLNVLIPILFLNFVMLTAGYLTEIKKISKTPGILFGFIPFLIYFYIIYVNYVTQNSSGFIFFWYFFFFWAMYGFVAVLPYNLKNSFYNILDLFSKNFFGLFLSYIIFTGSY
jgi:hypothetical protein